MPIVRRILRETNLQIVIFYELVDDISGVFDDYKLLFGTLVRNRGSIGKYLWNSQRRVGVFTYEMSLAPYDGQAVPQIKCRNETMYFVNCLIEDSSCLQTILAQYMIVFVQCTFFRFELYISQANAQ